MQKSVVPHGFKSKEVTGDSSQSSFSGVMGVGIRLRGKGGIEGNEHTVLFQEFGWEEKKGVEQGCEMIGFCSFLGGGTEH